MLKYKTIFFVHKTTDDQVTEIIQKRLVPSLSEIFNQKIYLGKVESNLLNETKYDLYFEVNCESKKTFDSLMNSQQGKNVNKELAGIFKDITLYSIEFPGDK